MTNNQHGGKREGSGRKKFPLTQKRTVVAVELKALIVELNRDYQEADNYRREQIREQLESIIY